MKKIELLMPCGDLERLKVALLYGGDAVFIGGKKFSLRAKASNFTLDDIEKGCQFAHALHKKVYVTVNIIPHYDDLKEIEDYLCALDKAGVDAIIVSSLAIIMLVNKLHLRLKCHVSTQVSSINEGYIDFYKRLGCTRVVLARECTLEDIKNIAHHDEEELEVFIQGGLCSSVSGKCTLSNYFVARDANRGGCAHSCRWDYDLYDENNQELSNEIHPFKIASKDLLGIEYVPDLIALNVASLKVEGRMKSLNYIAIVAKNYRKVIDKYYDGTLTNSDIENAKKELMMIESRPLCTGFLNKKGISYLDQIYLNESLMVNQTYLGHVEDYNAKSGIATIIRKNDMALHQKIMIFSYDEEIYQDEILYLSDEFGEVTLANKTENKVFIKTNKPLKKYYILRKCDE